jgi:hypothetical protein
VGKNRRVKGIWQGINLFKVHCMRLWNNHNQIPLYYKWFLIKKQFLIKNREPLHKVRVRCHLTRCYITSQLDYRKWIQPKKKGPSLQKNPHSTLCPFHTRKTWIRLVIWFSIHIRLEIKKQMGFRGCQRRQAPW